MTPQSQEQTAVATTSKWLPAMSIQDVIARRNAMVEFVKEAMKPSVDFGVIPGTDKPTLLKPGAEKLCTLFGMTTRFIIVESEKDWMGDHHNGEPFFYFNYRAQLYRGDALIAEADGSCSTMEKKYRWRNADRRCPQCGKPTIIKGKQEYGGGWICFAKKGGCGAKFGDNEPSIVEQQVGQVVNPDIADQVNTVQKMAQKRALIAATLIAVNASEFFTQDIEDMTIDGTFTVQPVAPKSEPTHEEHPVDERTEYWNWVYKNKISKADGLGALQECGGAYAEAKDRLAIKLAATASTGK